MTAAVRVCFVVCLVAATLRISYSKPDTTVTHKVTFDIGVGNRDAGKIVLGLLWQVATQDRQVTLWSFAGRFGYVRVLPKVNGNGYPVTFTHKYGYNFRKGVTFSGNLGNLPPVKTGPGVPGNRGLGGKENGEKRG
uniref:Putative secreted protein n=1 Tax=Ixodes ricinus TaxID=34613 RepID=V5IC66_IXORI